MTDLAKQDDRLPPHSTDAEAGILGCILQAPDETLPEVIANFKIEPEAFYDLRHRTLFETLLDMFDKREPIDVYTLKVCLDKRGQLEACGGLGYISRLPDLVPSAANLEYYCEIVQEKYRARLELQVMVGAISEVYEHDGDLKDVWDKRDRQLGEISRKFSDAGALLSTKQLVRQSISLIEDMHHRQGKLVGVGTGFADLDKITGGLREGDVTVIAARPGMGKTSLSMNIAEHVAVELGLPVGVFSLEMTAVSLMLRMLCSRARVNLRDIQDGFLAERDFPKLTNAAGKLANAPLFLDDTGGLTITQLRARARMMSERHGIKLFVIDYLQLLAGGRRMENRQQEIASISNGIKCMAKEFKVPVILLSQLNREVEKEKNRKPRLSDLRESGSIEQDADMVGILYRGESSDTEQNNQFDCAPVQLWVGKQRNGPTGDIPLTFLRSFTRFESAAKIHDNDIPQ